MSAKERVRATKSIARIAVRHDLDGDELLECIREAWDKGDSRCGDLTITCRKKTASTAIFLLKMTKFYISFRYQSKFYAVLNESLQEYHTGRIPRCFVDKDQPESPLSRVGASFSVLLETYKEVVDAVWKVLSVPSFEHGESWDSQPRDHSPNLSIHILA